eukprot:TRINITY_DN16856_c0_g1_i1.p2 TRINITY_DN16856_c0_g1~~TRINITY_DN16856_c0_g1_i1.p2  ORF type:complete len:105 (+),score=32.37 TRINITY_DN16856_c0_g1_i1:144-458(+)
MCIRDRSQGPSGVSPGSVAAYVCMLPVCMLWPYMACLPLLGAALMSLCFKTLAIQPARGTLLPVAILPLIMLGIVHAEPSVCRLVQLLQVELRMSWRHLAEMLT